MEIQEVLKQLGINPINFANSTGRKKWQNTERFFESYSPVDGQKIAKIGTTDFDSYQKISKTAQEAAQIWKNTPAPLRGNIVRIMGDAFRAKKEALGMLVSYEMGKSLQEGLGEVQEIIDICDFAVGLSRQLYGQTMHSERPQHRMYEQWHPLGVVGIISAFNFPVAVWAWNATLALVCGNVCIWKPSEKTPLTAIACQNIMSEIIESQGLPEGLSCLIQGDAEVGNWLVEDKKVALISATGSTKMGRIVGTKVAERFGKSILELGGNNAVIVSENADLNLVIPAIVFGAVGTAGQRCTTTRRVFVHKNMAEKLIESLIKIYGQLNIGDPLNPKIHVGPLIDTLAVKNYVEATQKVKEQGGIFVVEPSVLEGEPYQSGCYVKPCIALVENHYEIVQHETFAPILYLIKFSELSEAISQQNDVPQGLSSALFTLNMREAELFLSANGSDCGIANINIGTSGAEIGGAFGGEKETGGGRESGSDAWKAYMRRQTNTINYSTNLPLAQGIKFEL